MLRRQNRRVLPVRPCVDAERLEPRVLMDAAYQFSNWDRVWSFEGDRLGADTAGSRATVIDDINGDGAPDLMVSGIRRRTDVSFVADEGFVRFVSGKDASVIREVLSPNTQSFFTANFGRLTALLSDLDADGVRDVVISDQDSFIGNQGGVLRLYSARTGAQITEFATSATMHNLFGAGDLNGDGDGDLILTGAFTTSGQPQNVRAYSGRTGTILWETRVVAAGENDDRFLPAGFAIADADADGRQDLLVGGDSTGLQFTTMRGGAWLLSGATGTLIRAWEVSGDTGVGGTGLAYLGGPQRRFAVLNYDYATPSTPSSGVVGRVAVYELGAVAPAVWTTPDFAYGDIFGQTRGIAAAGDWNNDGVDEVAFTVDPQSRASSVRIANGADGGTLRTLLGTDVRPDRARSTNAVFFGSAIASGDLNGDGFNELLIRAEHAESPVEGKPNTNPFLAVVPALRFQTPTIIGANSAGDAWGVINGDSARQFITRSGVITLVKGLPGFVGGDLITGITTTDKHVVGARNTAGSNPFVVVNGRRIVLQDVALSSSTPAGPYGAAARVTAVGDVVVVERFRQNPDVDMAFYLVPGDGPGSDLLNYLLDGRIDHAAFPFFAGTNTAGTSVRVRFNNVALPPPGVEVTELPGIVIRGIANNGRVVGTGAGGASWVEPNETVVRSIAAALTAPVGGTELTVTGFNGRFASATYIPTGGATPIPVLLSFATPDTGPTWTADQIVPVEWLRAPAWKTNTSPFNILAVTPAGVPIGFELSSASSFALFPRNAGMRLETDATKLLDVAAVGVDGSVVLGVNLFGDVFVNRRATTSESGLYLPLAVPAGATVFGGQVWDNGAALATSSGLLVYDLTAPFASGGLPARNLTQLIAGSANIAASLKRMISIDGVVYLAGVTDTNRVVAYNSETPFPTGATGWVFQDFYTTVLQRFGIADPGIDTARDGELVTYVMPWNGLNVAGVNSVGEPVSFWTAPGLDGWRFTNLASVQEDPAAARGFRNLGVNVTPWGGVGITSGDSALRTVWWAPALGGQWRYASLVEVLAAGSPRPSLVASSVVAFATTWGGQNIAGVDADGHLWVYWWSPQTNQWVAESLQNAMNPSSALRGTRFTPNLAAYAASSQRPMGLAAVDTNGSLQFMSFSLDNPIRWNVEDLTNTLS